MVKELALNRIHRLDALEGLKRLRDKSIDLVVTDPPYNIASRNRLTMQSGKLVSTMDAWGKWDCLHPFDYDLMIMHVLSQCYRVLKPGGSLYMFTAAEDNGFFIRQAVARGFTVRNQLIMLKRTAMPSFAKKNWRRAFQVCMYLSKGTPATFNFISQRECINTFVYSTHNKQTTHPTEKSLPFIRRLVTVSSKPRDVVLDPFMGSGTTAVACRQLDRQFIGFDTDAEYVRMARNRLRRTKPDQPLKGGTEDTRKAA